MNTIEGISGEHVSERMSQQNPAQRLRGESISTAPGAAQGKPD